MTLIDEINSDKVSETLNKVLKTIHSKGPVSLEDLETLSLIKYFQPEFFKQEEKKLLYLLGLFYKVEAPDDLFSYSYNIFSDIIQNTSGKILTPIQACIKKQILTNNYYSFSAPTSTGKSFIFKDLLLSQNNDVVIVVPSRALIAEYVFTVREIVKDFREILVLQFIDDINKKKTKRKIFIVTPERASEIFKQPELYKFSLFLFDEAQISEEEIRGINFDALVRRIDKIFPDAKKVFAHPFISNPEAQLIKHKFYTNSNSSSFEQNTVGKMYVNFDSKKGKFFFFSPFKEKPNAQKNKYIIDFDLVEQVLLEGKRILIYTSKKSIYERKIEIDFKKYISLCPIIENPDAQKVISKIEEIIGAKGKNSELIYLMKRGVVVHHGSIPLNVRYLIEKFTNDGHAKICFATSTLAQGVNMPFDLVWIDNLNFNETKEKPNLGLKNLIGRAGRLTEKMNEFDYGYVVVKSINTFSNKLSTQVELSKISKLDNSINEIPDDLKEFVESIKDDTFNDEYNLPEKQLLRIREIHTTEIITKFLNLLFNGNQIISGSEYRSLSSGKRKKFKIYLHKIYENSLGRELESGEKSVLSAALTILLWQIQGKTFKQLLGLRYSYLTNQIEQAKLDKLLINGEISKELYSETIENMEVEYSAIPEQLPNKSLKKIKPSRYAGKKVKDFEYDLLVYDTYDFLDKVISFSLSNIFIAAFKEYYFKFKDLRALKLVNYFRYGTDDDTEIWLLRYGFTMEEIEKIKPFVDQIDDYEIIFNQSLFHEQNLNTKEMVNRYL
ncbi:MAG: DEAD/DEAH box helicase [Lentisphaeraceae bacterium]|nr:DEAD/DEAH box helicase [Lentisphaeraceae bacterium]